jgi:type II secretory pathway pseudopilin PulG
MKRGSLLLEIAIALSILGIISGFFITKTLTANRALRLQRTKNNIEITISALASYLASNNRLPRPSVGSDGMESKDVGCAMGHVPFRTLGISERNSLDGNARPLIYIMEPWLSDSFGSIYEGGNFSDKYFCRDVALQNRRIEILGQTPSTTGDMLAFALDTSDNRPTISGEKIIIKPATNTVWIYRNMLLIHHLKCAPCGERRRGATTSSRIANPFDDF